MEAGFKSAYAKAAYLQLKAERLLAATRSDEALAALLSAREALVKAYRFPGGEPLGQDARALRIRIGERLGIVLSVAGRDQEAEAEFDNTAAVYGGSGIHYLQACHLRLLANRILYEHNPAEALRLFLKARAVLDLTANLLPAGISADDLAKVRDDLDKSIAFLKGAHVEPAETPGK